MHALSLVKLYKKRKGWESVTMGEPTSQESPQLQDSSQSCLLSTLLPFTVHPNEFPSVSSLDSLTSLSCCRRTTTISYSICLFFSIGIYLTAFTLEPLHTAPQATFLTIHTGATLRHPTRSNIFDYSHWINATPSQKEQHFPANYLLHNK